MRATPSTVSTAAPASKEYIEDLGLKPARVRKWRQRDKERQFMRELKLLSGIKICKDCGQEKSHAPSCPHYERHLTETQAAVVKALLAQGYKPKDALLMVKSAEGQDFESLFRSALAPAANHRATGMTMGHEEKPDTQVGTEDKELDGAGVVASDPEAHPIAPSPERQRDPDPEPDSEERIETPPALPASASVPQTATYADWKNHHLPSPAYEVKYFEEASANFKDRYLYAFQGSVFKKILDMLEDKPEKVLSNAHDFAQLTVVLRSAAENLKLLAAAITTGLTPPPEPAPGPDQGTYGPPQSSTGDREQSRTTKAPTVWDCHAGKNYPPDAVYVGCRVLNRQGGVIREGSVFGNGVNPLLSHKGALHSEREFHAYAIEKLKDPLFRAEAEKLRGRDLLCWCVQEGERRAEFCHARVWLEMLNNSKGELTSGELPTEHLQDFEWGYYEPNLLSKKAADALLEMGKAQPRYRPVIKRSGHPLRRCASTCWSVRDPYADSVGMVPLAEAPPEIISLQRKLSDLAGKEVNYFSLQAYENERDHIGFHQHREDECRDARVFIISLGERRSFCVHKLCQECLLCDNCNRRGCHPDGPPCSNYAKCKAAKKHRKTCAVRKSTKTILLPKHGSLIALTSEANDWYEHAILDDKEPRGLRISINTKCIPPEDAAAGYVPRELRIAGGFTQHQALVAEENVLLQKPGGKRYPTQ
jgi:hypothetical protein